MRRRRQTGDKDDEAEEKDGGDPRRQGKKDAKSKVTLSSLLNFIDGLWSACAKECWNPAVAASPRNNGGAAATEHGHRGESTNAGTHTRETG